MIGRVVGTVMLFLLAGCAGMQQQQAAEIVQQAQAQLQTILQNCMQQMRIDRDLDPIREKVELIRTGISGAPPPGMLADRSRPTPEEKAAISKWQAVRDACAQEQLRYGLSLSLPPNLQPLRDRLVLIGRETNQRTGLLVASLYDGRLTYGQFAAEHMKITDQMVASMSGSPSPHQPSQTSANAVSAGAGASSTYSGADEIVLSRTGNTFRLPVVINRLFPIEFLLDTGASDVALPAEVVLTLLRTKTLRSSDFIGYTTYVLADGRRVPSRTFKIRELQVGSHVARDVTASVGDLGTVPLLGGSFLSTLGSWTIDNQRNALVLSR